MKRAFLLGLSVIAATTVAMHAEPSDGLVAYYAFDEAPEIQDIKDGSGRGRDGKTNATPSAEGVEITHTTVVSAEKGVRFPNQHAVLSQPVKVVLITRSGEEIEMQEETDFQVSQRGVKLLRDNIPVGSKIRLTYHYFNENLARVEGKKGSALEFDGINDWASAPLDETVDFAGGMTIATWINPAKRLSPIEILFSVGGSWGLSFYENALAFRFAGIFESPRKSGNIRFRNFQRPVDQWTHVAVASNGSDLRLYVNGIETDVYTDEFGGTVPRPITGEIRLGGINSYNFSGKIDEVRLYDRALTPQEIATLATSAP
jgi:hypothetical protein